MPKHTLTQADLAQFTGTENWYRHPLCPRITYTDGVKYMAEHAGAYWLLDLIVSHQLDAKVRREEFQVWKLQVTPEGKASVVCEDGNDNMVTRQDIEFSDFPLPEMTLWFTNDVILLPSEY